ncbi:hypothetical protein [Ensifer adhaerens]|uniref:hypothetical protein n=1 Tax=Ensifer adhaerens TaxID=106592 RepID=UPI0015C3D6CC|nr:hypothetical protein [Ensifer adhaerens]
MLPDVFTALFTVRFLVFTPFVIACILAVRRWPYARLYDVLAVAIAVLGVTLPMAVATQSTSPYLFVYQNGNSAAFLFFVIALRPRFLAVLAGLALMCASHFTTTHLSVAFDDLFRHHHFLSDAVDFPGGQRLFSGAEGPAEFSQSAEGQPPLPAARMQRRAG